MSIELDFYYEEPPKVPLEVAELGLPEFAIRPHHVGNYYDIIDTLLDDSVTNLKEFAVVYGASQKDYLIKFSSTKEKQEEYQRQYGYQPGRTDIPGSYIEDLMGPADDSFRTKVASLDSYEKRFAKVVYDFLTLPDHTPVAIGTSLDPICKVSHFGSGQGGFHCRQITDEDGEAYVVQRRLENYRNEKRAKDGYKYNPTIDYVVPVNERLDSLFQTIPGLVPQALSIKTSLGLLRDQLTKQASWQKYTRGDKNLFLSYADLMKHRLTSLG